MVLVSGRLKGVNPYTSLRVVFVFSNLKLVFRESFAKLSDQARTFITSYANYTE